MTGGLQALIEHPGQLAHLQADMSLLPTAVDEMIRWVTPVRHFTRMAQADTELAGTPIAQGDLVYLSYLAANRDPRVFDDPHTFDVGRSNADRHVAFGFGTHFCLGAQLARMELRTLFRDLLPRLEQIELDDTPTSMKTIFVGGSKSLPIRYRLRELPVLRTGPRPRPTKPPQAILTGLNRARLTLFLLRLSVTTPPIAPARVRTGGTFPGSPNGPTQDWA